MEKKLKNVGGLLGETMLFTSHTGIFVSRNACAKATAEAQKSAEGRRVFYH
jgi:hypothetical protein